jgi:hypothetical protein
MTTRYLHSLPPEGAAKYFVEGDWIYEMDGRPAFFIQDGWAYTVSGQPAFWIDGEWLYPHGGNGRAALYFG